MRIFVSVLIFSLSIFQLNAQFKSSIITRESEVPKYQLPELLISENEQKITTKEQWETIRRPELLEFFTNQVYGIMPSKKIEAKYQTLEFQTNSLKGKATRKQVNIIFSNDDKKISMSLLIYTPIGVKKSPVFLGYNFNGNHTVNNDPEILINGKQEDELGEKKIMILKRDARGSRSSRWAIDKIIESGYGLVTVNYNDIDPDKNDFSDGIHPLFYSKGQLKPESDQWGSISAWAWGMFRVMDYLEIESLVDEKKVILFGHSRLGKTALWAGANDNRFSIVISNNSGCGGAAISRRRFGEKVSDINKNFPHWFAKNFHNYNENESALPIDQHMLVALIAPRPVYVASASEDSWADPKGEFISAKEASIIYDLYNLKGINSSSFLPPVNTPIHRNVGYHLREGDHDVTEYDWNQFIEFARIYFSLYNIK